MTTLRVSICGIAGLFFVGCATTPLDETGTVDSGSEPSDTDADTDSEDSGGGDTGTPTQGDTRTLSGTIQWTVDFDAEAEALGFTDCAYTREYAGIEDKSQPWLCPECAVVYRVDATVIDGLMIVFHKSQQIRLQQSGWWIRRFSSVWTRKLPNE